MFKSFTTTMLAFGIGGFIGFYCVVLFGVWGIFIAIPVAGLVGFGLGALAYWN